MEDLTDLNGFGVIAQVSEVGIGLRSSGVDSRRPDDARQASENGFGSPEASEGEDRDLEWPVRVVDGSGDGGFGHPIGSESDAEGFLRHENAERKP